MASFHEEMLRRANVARFIGDDHAADECMLLVCDDDALEAVAGQGEAEFAERVELATAMVRLKQRRRQALEMRARERARREESWR